MGSLDGMVALVTGGSSGIGRAASLAFAREGAKVVVASRGTQAGEETVRAIEHADGEAVFVKTDVSVPSQAEGMVAEATPVSCIAEEGRVSRKLRIFVLFTARNKRTSENTPSTHFGE
jgi:NAD(P)-dependent dehydrogenase (short-subunit alcohol dehydrogenase family)